MLWKQLREPTDDDRQALDLEYRGRARFLVDESAGAKVAEILRSHGYNTRFVTDLALRGQSDEEVFASAWRENRTIITHDPDFLDNRRFPHHRNPGVVLVRPGSDGRDNSGLLTCLMKALLLAGKNATWFRGRKLDFSSEENLTITSRQGRRRYLWRKHGMPSVWED